MRALRAWVVRAATLLRGRRREREMAEEFESHLQLHIDDNIRAGMTPEQARRAAIVKFGPVEATKEAYRDRAGIPVLEIVLQDLRYAVRRLRRQPLFALLIVLTLALGVGANAAMFGLVDALMFRTPDHVRDPQGLVEVGAGTYVKYRELTAQLRSVELAVYTNPVTLSLGAGAAALPLRTQCVTPAFFPLLGASPHAGRAFAPADDTPGSGRTLVLSHGFWSRHFGADPGAIGRTVTVSGRSFTIIGIAPRRFAGLAREPVDAWTLLALSPEACSFTGTNLMEARGGGWLTTIGRLREGVTFAQTATELTAVEAGSESRPTARRTGERPATLSLLYPPRRAVTRDGLLALWLAGGASILLLLACANVAALLSIRAVDRRREVAVRLQLGATRRRVFGQLVIEHLLLAALGGVVAALVAIWLGTALERFFPLASGTDLVRAHTLLALGALALTAGVLSGTLPALHASRATGVTHLRSGYAAAGGRSRFRSVLLTAQVAFALMLVVGAGLFVRSVENYRQDFSYDLDRVITAAIDFRRFPDADPRRILATFELLLDRVRQLPQVESAALSSGEILGAGGAIPVSFVQRSAGDPPSCCHRFTEVTSGYFATLGLRTVSGRTFTEEDRSSGAAIVLNETLARTLFPGENPLGRRLLVQGARWVEVVGVSEPFRATVGSHQTDSHVYVPFDPAGDDGNPPQVLLVRTRRDASREMAAIAAALQGASPDLPYVDVRPLSDLADAEARSWLLGATVFSLFGTLAVILSAIGIYGTLAFATRQRTTEIGVRMALGARRRDVAAMILRYAAFIVAAGAVLGAAGGFAASRFVRSLLFNVAPDDPGTFVAAALVMAIAALAGSLIPAARAARIDPAVA